MEISIIIHGASKQDGTRIISYVETIDGKLYSRDHYIRKFSEETYNNEITEAIEKRERRNDFG